MPKGDNMLNFDFYNPTKLIFGEHTIKRIGKEISSYGYEKVVLVAGGGSIKKNGVYNTVTDSLKNNGIEFKEVWGVRANPVISKVNEIIKTAKDFNTDCLLAVGGGSVIDSVKAASAGVFVDNVWDLFEYKKPVKKGLPVFTVLTLSATGSEMNCYSVVTNEAEKKKWNIAGNPLYPIVSIVDPTVQYSLPWHQTLNGSLDALSHIMELYFANDTSETTLALNESLSATIVKMTDMLQKNDKNYNARANLAWAATLALNGISAAGQGGGDWATHGIEHGVSAVYPDIAHGAGLGVLFPAWIEYCQGVNPSLFERWAKNIWKGNSVKEGIENFKSKIRTWHGAVTLRDLGVDKNKLNEIADIVVLAGMTGKVKKLNREDIVNILNIAW
jgi:alcohol dehydrogenase YqhD (iron-dependent ADH family)